MFLQSGFRLMSGVRLVCASHGWARLVAGVALGGGVNDSYIPASVGSTSRANL